MQNWNQPCALLPRVCSAIRLTHVCAGLVSRTAGVRAGVDGLAAVHRSGRGRRATRALAGAVPRRSGHDRGKPREGWCRWSTAGEGRPGRARSRGRPALPAVVPVAAGPLAAGVPPSSAGRRSLCPPAFRSGWHHRRPAVASPRPDGDPGLAPSPTACLSRPFPGFPWSCPLRRGTAPAMARVARLPRPCCNAITSRRAPGPAARGRAARRDLAPAARSPRTGVVACHLARLLSALPACAPLEALRPLGVR